MFKKLDFNINSIVFIIFLCGGTCYACYERYLYQQSLNLRPGFVYYAHGNYRQAIPYLSKLERLEPENKGIAGLIGYSQLKSGDTEGAIRTLTAFVSQEPENAEAHYWLGNAFQKNRQRKEAREQWRLALNNSPDEAIRLSAQASLKPCQYK